MRKGIFERAYLNWHYRKDILMKDISERAFPKGHFDEGHFEGRAFPKGERAKGMKGIVHKLEFPQKHKNKSHHQNEPDQDSKEISFDSNGRGLRQPKLHPWDWLCL